ncbi:MAG: NUDIX domain-containing protein [Anaerolineae bacterium]|nr:NUDIX domain-containing protein [Anaerolineae bacterium]
MGEGVWYTTVPPLQTRFTNIPHYLPVWELDVSVTVSTIDQHHEEHILDVTIRYHGAVIRDGSILLVKQGAVGGYQWWDVPGGGREPGESEEECVIRELREETHLDVIVDGLLIDGPSHPHSPYRRFKIYLCTPIDGTARPDGVEVTDVGWFDLRSHDQMALASVNNETARDTLQRICQALGYL